MKVLKSNKQYFAFSDTRIIHSLLHRAMGYWHNYK